MKFSIQPAIQLFSLHCESAAVGLVWAFFSVVLAASMSSLGFIDARKLLAMLLLMGTVDVHLFSKSGY